MRTIDDAIKASPDNASGFDYLRIVLAFSVIGWHTFAVSYGSENLDFIRNSRIWWPLVFLILPSFFALSGFLVAGSLERNTLPAFLTLRALRIFPALAVEVLLSAFLIGPLVTTYTWPGYFSDPLFFHYLLNVFGRVHFFLPGVFNGLPFADYVNAQLWTVPWELRCYVSITLLALVGLTLRPRLFLILAMMLCAAMTAYSYFENAPAIQTLDIPLGGPLVLSFLMGVGLYLFRERIPYDGIVFAVAAATAYALLQTTATLYLSAIPISYMTAFVGLQRFPRTWVIRHADYSYGVYLYGFPIQQLVALLFPDHRSALFNLLISAPAAMLCAAASWHLIERPILGQKKAATLFVNRMWVHVRGGLMNTDAS